MNPSMPAALAEQGQVTDGQPAKGGQDDEDEETSSGVDSSE
jgi:hypothetical protein